MFPVFGREVEKREQSLLVYDERRDGFQLPRFEALSKRLAGLLGLLSSCRFHETLESLSFILH